DHDSALVNNGYDYSRYWAGARLPGEPRPDSVFSLMGTAHDGGKQITPSIYGWQHAPSHHQAAWPPVFQPRKVEYRGREFPYNAVMNPDTGEAYTSDLPPGSNCSQWTGEHIADPGELRYGSTGFSAQAVATVDWTEVSEAGIEPADLEDAMFQALNDWGALA